MATQNDWQEYFELMNDRKPSEAEVNAAIASGEIDAPAVTQTTEVPTSVTKEAVETPTPVVTPTQTTGVPSQSQQGQQQFASGSTPASTMLSDFWAWIKMSIHQPDSHQSTVMGMQFGLYTLIANAVMIGIMGMVSEARTYRGVFDFFYPYMYSSVHSGASFQTFMVLGLGTLAISMAIVLGVFAVRRGIYRDVTFTFGRSLEYIGRLMVLVLALNIVAFVALVLALYPLFIFIWIIGFALFSFIGSFAVFTSTNNTSVNTFYVALLGTTVYSLIVVTITWLTFLLLLGQMLS